MTIEFISGSKPLVGDVEPPPNLLHLMWTGLGADPGGYAAGMRAQASAVLGMYPKSDYAIIAWDGDGWGEDAAIKQCQDVLGIIQRGNSVGPYTRIICRGHSFGGCFLVYFLNWLIKFDRVAIDLALFLDPVPEMNLAEDGHPLAFVGRTPWTVPMDLVSKALQILQHNGSSWWFPIGPNGTQLIDPANTGRLATVEVSRERNPKIYHGDVPADPRTWAMQLMLIQEVMS